jgi:hypothetical protein
MSKSDTRRKTLAGAVALEWASRNTEFSITLMAELTHFVARDADRALFRLPPVIKPNGAEKGAV